jgi:hypothetical protein
MKFKVLAVAALILTSTSVQSFAVPVTVFGEDISTTGNPVPFTNATTAQNSLFSNLVSVGTETFDAIANGTAAPSVSFGAIGTATLTTGSAFLRVDDGTLSPIHSPADGYYPFSGAQFLYSQDNFTVAFSTPISAFGFYGTDIGDHGGQLTLTLTDINNVISILNIPHTLVSDGSTNGSNLYFGFYDTNALYKQIAFGTSAPNLDGFTIDNMSAGYATPLPAALPLFASGFGGVMGLLGWRRKRKKAAAIAAA